MDISALDDQQIVEAILRRDTGVTREFLYRKCYPLFASIHGKYYTDCQTPVELINEIYVYILVPSRKTGRSKLEDFGFRCSLPMWLKIVTENYCRQLYTKIIPIDENNDMGGDRNLPSDVSIQQSTFSQDMADTRKLLSLMPNSRYRQLIEYRYLDERSNEETAELMGMTMANYYNLHKRAKNQYCEILKKEGLL